MYRFVCLLGISLFSPVLFILNAIVQLSLIIVIGIPFAVSLAITRDRNLCDV